MIESQLAWLSAIGAFKPVAQKHVKPRKGWRTVLSDEFMQGNHARQTHLEALRPNNIIILGDNLDTIEKDSFDNFLPALK